MKPDLVAPGVRIAAARSTPRGEAPASGIAVKSGTSMAAPHVAGTVAVMFEAHGRPLDILDTRALLLGSADRPAMDDEAADPYQVGSGCLNPVAAEAAARLWVQDDSVEDAMSALRHTDDSDESGRSFADSAAPAEALVAGGAAGSETLLVEPAWSRRTEEITPEDQPPEEIAAHPAFRELLLEMADAAPVHDSDDLRVLALSARGHDAEGPLVAIADPSVKICPAPAICSSDRRRHRAFTTRRLSFRSRRKRPGRSRPAASRWSRPGSAFMWKWPRCRQTGVPCVQ